MTDRYDLNFIYKNNLENDIIRYLSEVKKISLRQAIDIYYHSKMSEQISQGMYGIENMDYKYLVQDIIENEPELF